MPSSLGNLLTESQVIRGREEPVSPARAHIMGGAAILTTFLNLRQAPAEGPRGLLQMCYSMLASNQGSFQYSSPEPNAVIPTVICTNLEKPLPGPFFEWISVIDKMVSAIDVPSAELLKSIVQFSQLSALVRSQPLTDGHPTTSNVIREALEINDALESWQSRQAGAWAVIEEHLDDVFPPEAVFEGCYHVYENTYIARVWNHYRWAHTMVNQMLLESIDLFPVSSAPLVTPEQQERSLDRIRRLARDTLVSIPTHYRHPALQPVHWDYFEKTKSTTGIGFAGIPTLLFEIKVAVCAPGVSDYYRRWALGMLETAYRDTGMFQARALAGFLRKMLDDEASRSASSASSSPSTVGDGS